MIQAAAADLDCQVTLVDPATRTTSDSCIIAALPGLEYAFNLRGDFQLDNSAIAIRAISSIFPDISNSDIIKGMSLVRRWPGRLDYITLPDAEGELIVDGAHNLDAACVLAAYIDKNERNDTGVFWIYAATAGKDVQSILHVLLNPGDSVYFTRFGRVDEMPWINAYEDWDGVVVGEGVSVVGERGGGLEEGLACGLKSGRRVVVCGSLYLVAELYRLKGLI